MNRINAEERVRIPVNEEITTALQLFVFGAAVVSGDLSVEGGGVVAGVDSSADDSVGLSVTVSLGFVVVAVGAVVETGDFVVSGVSITTGAIVPIVSYIVSGITTIHVVSSVVVTRAVVTGAVVTGAVVSGVVVVSGAVVVSGSVGWSDKL